MGRQKIRESMLADVPYYNYKNPKFLNQVVCKAQIRFCEAYRVDYINHNGENCESVICWK
jgi:hypothetical protein